MPCDIAPMGLDFLRRADWIDRRAQGYAMVLALLNLGVLAWLVASSHDGIDRNGFLLGTDFLSFWTSGRMLHDGADVYNAAAHIAAQRTYFAQDGAFTAFFYPPPFLIACWPLGLFGYFTALGLWLLATGGAYLVAVRSWAGKETFAHPLWLMLAAFPPVLITITHGQTSFLVAALLGSGALLVGRKPWLAGVLIGLAVIKPQFGLLVPLLLLLTAEWRTIMAAALTIGLLALATTLLFGPQVWSEWLAVSAQAQQAMAQGIVPYAKMQSLFAAARLLGASLPLAYALQGALLLAVAASLVRASLGRHYTPTLACAMLVGALLGTPFVLDYDMVLLVFPLIHLAATGYRPWEKLVSALAFVAPAFARPLAMEAGIPIMPVILAALFALLIRRVIETPAPAGGPPARG